MRNLFNNLSDHIRQMMYGRYGSDDLNRALLVLFFVLWLPSLLIPVDAVRFVLQLLCDAVLIWSLFRMLSRSYAARRKENDWFLEVSAPLRSKLNQMRHQMSDRDYKYFSCPQCHKNYRAPRGKGKIRVNCKCGATFEQKT